MQYESVCRACREGVRACVGTARLGAPARRHLLHHAGGFPPVRRAGKPGASAPRVPAQALAGLLAGEGFVGSRAGRVPDLGRAGPLSLRRRYDGAPRRGLPGGMAHGRRTARREPPGAAGVSGCHLQELARSRFRPLKGAVLRAFLRRPRPRRARSASRPRRALAWPRPARRCSCLPRAPASAAG